MKAGTIHPDIVKKEEYFIQEYEKKGKRVGIETLVAETLIPTLNEIRDLLSDIRNALVKQPERWVRDFRFNTVTLVTNSTVTVFERVGRTRIEKICFIMPISTEYDIPSLVIVSDGATIEIPVYRMPSLWKRTTTETHFYTEWDDEIDVQNEMKILLKGNNITAMQLCYVYMRYSYLIP